MTLSRTNPFMEKMSRRIDLVPRYLLGDVARL